MSQDVTAEFPDILKGIMKNYDLQAKHKNWIIYWNLPQGWKGQKPLFAYTPWKVTWKGKEGFYAVTYRWRKSLNGWHITKAVYCRTRKRAKALSIQWYKKYYGPKEVPHQIN